MNENVKYIYPFKAKNWKGVSLKLVLTEFTNLITILKIDFLKLGIKHCLMIEYEILILKNWFLINLTGNIYLNILIILLALGTKRRIGKYYKWNPSSFYGLKKLISPWILALQSIFLITKRRSERQQPLAHEEEPQLARREAFEKYYRSDGQSE